VTHDRLAARGRPAVSRAATIPTADSPTTTQTAGVNPPMKDCGEL
jgi:hypothetical protein